MLTCIAGLKHGSNNDADDPDSKQAIKTLSSQIKGIALKASGAYKCNPCSHPTPKQPTRNAVDPDAVGSGLARFMWSGSYRRTMSSGSASRLKDGTPSPSSSSSSGRRMEPPLLLVEETEPKEWVAQVEPGVLITFVSLPRGGNDLKRIRFSRDKYNKEQAQKWWTDNYEKVMELYNVQRLNQQDFPLPTPLRTEDEISKAESARDSPMTPPLTRESLPRNLNRGYSSSDSYDQQSTKQHSCNTSAATSSMRSSSNASSDLVQLETEWVEEDEPGVYITIRALPGGTRELRRVRFSREQFGEMHARLWWEENRARIHEQYFLVRTVFVNLDDGHCKRKPKW
ncbi:hypothetical protein V2J09_017716 [Rumex salicifolius]